MNAKLVYILLFSVIVVETEIQTLANNCKLKNPTYIHITHNITNINIISGVTAKYVVIVVIASQPVKVKMSSN